MRRAYLVFVLVLIFVPVLSDLSVAQVEKTAGGRIVVCMIQLEHADAEYLASILKPFLSPEGRLTSYKPTNTLIIRDREPVVNMLAEIIKGKPCTPTSQSPSN